MSTPYFSTPERIAVLDAEADSWIGTPFANYGAVKGENGGASCACLAAAILKGAGFETGEDVPVVRVNYARRHTEGIMLPYFRSHKSAFEEVVPLIDNLIPGDILVMNLGELCAHHIAVVVSGESVIHTVRVSKTSKIAMSDPSFTQYAIEGAFRPIE